MPRVYERRSIEERFQEKIEKTDTCWNWKARLFPSGYGQFQVDATHPRRAHRVAWELEYGPIPEGMCVLHHCDNPKCVNPRHLFLGTNLDNSRDMVAKGRQKSGPHPGETNFKAKLTDMQVREIRVQCLAHTRRYCDIARDYRVGKFTIQRIASRRAWRHVA